MIRMLEGLPDGVVGFEAVGEVHADDYKRVLDPALEKAMAAHDKVNVLYVLGEDFTGYTAAAMWQDAMVGMEDFSHWERVAVVSDTSWVHATVHAFAWMLPSRIRTFPVAERANAEAWLAGE